MQCASLRMGPSHDGLVLAGGGGAAKEQHPSNPAFQVDGQPEQVGCVQQVAFMRCITCKSSVWALGASKQVLQSRCLTGWPPSPHWSPQLGRSCSWVEAPACCGISLSMAGIIHVSMANISMSMPSSARVCSYGHAS